MVGSRHPVLARCLILLLTFALGGCLGGGETRLYSFSNVRPDEVQPQGRARGLVVVGPVSLNPEVDRPQLVIHRSDSAMEIRERDQWAGTLEEQIKGLMVDALGGMLGVGRVVAFPWTGREPAAYRVSPEIKEMRATPGAGAQIQVAWSIYDERSGRRSTLPARTYQAQVAAGAEMSAIVSTYRDLLLRASRDIAGTLRR